MTKAPTIHACGTYTIRRTRLFGPIDVTIPARQWTCILGRSGVGKSTLLRLIAGLTCAGDFDGKITTSDGATLDNRISLMAQSDLLLTWLSVLENTMLGASLRGERPDHERAESMLQRVGLSDHQHKKPHALSGGMRQRNALARTLIEDRPVALLDEPFSALDASTRADMQDLAAELLVDKTVLLITHDPVEAVRLAHQIIVLTSDGAATWAALPMPPVRDQHSAAAVRYQAELLNYLRHVP
jgi:putative hydroxymethylpyrimidine transport system ATP-binding protein